MDARLGLAGRRPSQPTYRAIHGNVGRRLVCTHRDPRRYPPGPSAVRRDERLQPSFSRSGKELVTSVIARRRSTGTALFPGPIPDRGSGRAVWRIGTHATLGADLPAYPPTRGGVE